MSSGETWLLNESIAVNSMSYSQEYSTTFTSNGNTYTKLKVTGSNAPLVSGEWLAYIYYDTTLVHSDGYTDYWENQAYRTITFETAPTGDLLTWLQNNGTKQ